MPAIIEDPWINDQNVQHNLAELEGCAIAVDATYYMQTIVDGPHTHEPLLPALGGMTGLIKSIEADLDNWAAHNVTPFFVFDGQVVTGQDEVSVISGQKANHQSDVAWELYFGSKAEQAVSAFGLNVAAKVESLYPMLQDVLKKRQLHFLVAPYKAAMQLAHFEAGDSDQCSGIMGSQELLLYPINDCVIRSIDWERETVTTVSKKHLLKALNITEKFFIDALLTTGTSFLTPFPPLLEASLIKQQPPTIMDAVNLLRTTEKSVTIACTSSFNDIVQAQEPNWLDKFYKARMVVSHFIYISEAGEVKVHDFEHLTNDNHLYLGLQLPAELFHYLNTGLIGPKILSWITHGQIVVYPTMDGFQSPEYRKLVEQQTVPIKEQTVGLLIPGLHRGIQHKPIGMRVWYDNTFTRTINPGNIQPPPASKSITWTVNTAAVKEHFPQFQHGSIASEVLALKKPEFVKTTIAKGKAKGINSADAIVTLTIWRFLHVRGYVNDTHTLTSFGNALAKALESFAPTVAANPEVPFLNESLVVAMELARFDILNAKNRHENLKGFPIHGSEDDQLCLLLISRCASLLGLRHKPMGYTGPLSKNLLHFRSLVSEVRGADRGLTEALVVSVFMHAQGKRDRDDYFELGRRLPFLNDPNVALGIAVKTYFDDVQPGESAEQKEKKKSEFPKAYLPYATHFAGDLEIACRFFDAVYEGIKTLGEKDLPKADRMAWDRANEYLRVRR